MAAPRKRKQRKPFDIHNSNQRGERKAGYKTRKENARPDQQTSRSKQEAKPRRDRD